MILTPSNILTALNQQALGTKVTNVQAFMGCVLKAIAGIDFAAQRVPGAGIHPLCRIGSHLSAGVGRRTDNPADYVVRSHRGRVDAYLRHEVATGYTPTTIGRESLIPDKGVRDLFFLCYPSWYREV